VFSVLRASAETAGSFSGFYAVKPASYFSNARSDFVDRLPRDSSAQILEIGCGTGATGALALSEGCCGRYVGVELFENAAEEARDVLSDVIVGNVETLEFDWQPATFDALILSEVLEHLVAPGEVLNGCRALARRMRSQAARIFRIGVIRELVIRRFQLADRALRSHASALVTPILPTSRQGGLRRRNPTVTACTRTGPISAAGRLDHLFATQIAMIAQAPALSTRPLQGLTNDADRQVVAQVS
jgi:SAM-dependent methyltransferase